MESDLERELAVDAEKLTLVVLAGGLAKPHLEPSTMDRGLQPTEPGRDGSGQRIEDVIKEVLLHAL